MEDRRHTETVPLYTTIATLQFAGSIPSHGTKHKQRGIGLRH